MLDHYDLSTSAEATSRPGGDTRQWASFATVDADSPDQRSVEFTTEYGPLVSVTLQPSGVPARCRVAGAVAGNREADWVPFVAGDEVAVLIPEGDEAYATIIGRLNQELDAWPRSVAGQDSTTNTFGFRRMRTPYIFELSGSYLLRQAKAGSFLSLKDDGSVTLANGDNSFLTLTASVLGLQSGDATTLLQVDVENKRVNVEANGTKLVVDGKASSFYTKGVLQVGTSGNQAAEHATSIEAVANLVACLISFLGVASSPGGAAGAAALATALNLLNTPVLAQVPVAALLTTSSKLPLTPALIAALTGALSSPKSPGSIPGVGAPGLLIG